MASGTDPNETVDQLNRDLLRISQWADKWKVTFNAKKSKDMIFSNKYLNNSPPLVFGGTNIERVNSHKHLGLILTSNLDWGPQINAVSLKANQKLSVLRSVKLLNRRTLDLLYKITVRSVIDYGLQVYYKSLRLTDIARLDNIQYRAGKIVTGAFHFTNKEKLNRELGWESISQRGDILSLSFFHKIHLHETRPLIRTCMPKVNFDINLQTRSINGYIPSKYKGANFEKSFFPNTLKLWNSLPKNVLTKNLTDFKTEIKTKIKPPKYKHFSRGSKQGNSLLTKIRVDRSDLKQHKFAIGQSDSPECFCHYKTESPEHYFLDCFLYLPERRIMFDLIEHFIPNFPRLNRKQKLEIIIKGIDIDNDDLVSTNITITKAVQRFLISSKRFTLMET